MTIRDLIDELENYATEHGDDVEVRLAHQPRWPFEYAVGNITCATTKDDDEDDELVAADDAGSEAVVYIGEGTQLGYLGGAAARALGWGRER